MTEIDDAAPAPDWTFDLDASRRAIEAARQAAADVSWRAQQLGRHLHDQWDAYLEETARAARAGRPAR